MNETVEKDSLVHWLFLNKCRICNICGGNGKDISPWTGKNGRCLSCYGSGLVPHRSYYLVNEDVIRIKSLVKTGVL